jgi:DHA1 family bicyclomycin/chloramphenicol resistance-like MFS transporter
MYIPGLPELRHSFEATTPAAQLTFSVCLLGMAVGQIIFGPMSDALGRRRPLVWALAGYTVSAIVCVMTPWLWLLIVARLIQGATASAGIVISRAVTRDLFSGREAIVFYARLMLVFGLAPILAPIAGGQIIDLVGWRAVFLVLAVIGAILTAVVHRSMEETLAPERRHDARASDLWRGLGALLRDRTFVRLLVAGTMAQAILMTYLGTAPFVLRSTYGYSAQKFSLVFAANAVGLIGGSQVTSLLAARFGQSAPLRVGVCLAALAGASLPVVAVAGESQLAVLLCLFTLITAVGIIMPSTIVLAMSAHADLAGTASGVLGLCGALLGAASAPLLGWIGPGSVLVLSVCMAVYSLVALGPGLVSHAPASAS